MEVIDSVSADQIEELDTIQFVYNGETRTLDVKTVEDTGDRIKVRGYSHETGDNITVKFRPRQRVDIMGA